MGEQAADVRIRRQVLAVELHGSQAEGHALQRRLPEVCARVLSPALQSALDPFDPGDGHLALDQLTIEVSASLDQLEAELATAIRRGVAEHFARHPPRRAVPSKSQALVGELQHRTAQQAADEALITFLRSGRLPWSFRLAPGRTLESVLLDRWRAVSSRDDSAGGVRLQLRELLKAPLARQRLILQFSPAFTVALLAGLSPELADMVARVHTVLHELEAGSAPVRSFGRHVLELALSAALADRVPAPPELVAAAWRALDPPGIPDGDLARVLDTAWPDVTRVRGSSAPGGSAAESLISRAKLTVASPAEPGGKLVESPVTRPRRPFEGLDEPGGVLIDNAGLVLLHPFLTRFLEGLGVAAGDELLDADRALALLHFLATGEVTAPEHRLALAKVLLGVASEQPNEADVGLTADDLTEATALLEAVIGHWDVLRSTSPDGLRAEFLQRGGVLSQTPDGDWLLRIETRTLDILLDQLPWGLSSFRLPWMDRLMFVEWR